LAGRAIHFVLSREAAVCGRFAVPRDLVALIPTFHSKAVIELLEPGGPMSWCSTMRVGTRSCARAPSGARIVYVSARPRQRRKAFRRNWMRLIDEHWIAYPQFIAGSLTLFENLSSRRLGGPFRAVLWTSILPRADLGRRGAVLSRAGCGTGTFVLVVPGAAPVIRARTMRWVDSWRRRALLPHAECDGVRGSHECGRGRRCDAGGRRIKLASSRPLARRLTWRSSCARRA